MNLVIAQRQYCDGDYLLLPERLENTSFASGNTLFKGEDLLDVLDVLDVLESYKLPAWQD